MNRVTTAAVGFGARPADVRSIMETLLNRAHFAVTIQAGGSRIRWLAQKVASFVVVLMRVMACQAIDGGWMNKGLAGVFCSRAAGLVASHARPIGVDFGFCGRPCGRVNQVASAARSGRFGRLTTLIFFGRRRFPKIMDAAQHGATG